MNNKFVTLTLLACIFFLLCDLGVAERTEDDPGSFGYSRPFGDIYIDIMLTSRPTASQPSGCVEQLPDATLER